MKKLIIIEINRLVAPFAGRRQHEYLEEVLYTEDPQLKDSFYVAFTEIEEKIPEGLKKGVWKHFKPGKTYEVIGVAFRKKTGQWLVIYKSLYYSRDYPIGTLWGRPIDSFLGTKKLEDGTEVSRFQYIENYTGGGVFKWIF